MNLSERSIKRLQEIITGDKGLSPYRSGPKLVSFFNEIGTNAVYGEGFPSRWIFAEDCIRQFNDSPAMKQIIVSALDPRDYMDAQVLDPELNEHVPADIEKAVEYLNKFFSYDGYKIVAYKNKYDVQSLNEEAILIEHELDPNELSYAFMSEQIEKCRTKISQEDFDGAITNARSLVEAVLLNIEKEFTSKTANYDGNLPKLYKRVQRHLNLTPDNQQIEENLKQTLRGLINIVNGLASLSNTMGDRHVRTYKPSRHHSTLVVNSAMTFCNFIFDSFKYQKNLNN